MREIVIGAAQMGPNQKADSREAIVARMLALLEEAGRAGCTLVVYPELALTTFFPRWYMEDQAEVDRWFESEMPNAEVRPLFAAAVELGVGFYLGYAELAWDPDGTKHRYNTSILVDETGAIVGKYRKVHLPGHREHEPWRPFQHLEKRYFEPGNLGFPVFRAFGGIMGMCICNDRRWPETFRVMGLQGAEMILLGYNTPLHYPPAPEHDHLQDFHNHLCLQAAAYQNGSWVVGVAKAGCEEGCDLIGGTCIVAPTGEIVTQVGTLGDELAIADCDLDRCREIKDNVFNFALHREPDSYRLIVETKGAKPPPNPPSNGM